MLIEPRLEGVDGAEGAQLLDEVVAVLRQELGGVIAEEVPCVGAGQQLHGLGMDLRQIGTQAHIVRQGLAAVGEVALKAVAQLVGIDGDIGAGAVAVGEDEGHPAGGAQHIAEAHAGNFIGGAGHVQQVVADHLVEEVSRLRAQGMVHPAGGLGQFLRRHGDGVALREHQRPVTGQQCFHPQPLALLLLHLQVQGGDVLLHLTAEFVQLRPAIAQTLHAEIAVVGEAVEAVFTGQLIPGMDQLPQQFFHRRAVFHGGLLLGIVGGPAAFPVGAGQRKAQLAAAESLALHLILGGGHQLLVLGGELGDAGLQLLAAGVEPLIQRQQTAQLGAEGLIHRRSIGTLRNGHGQGLGIQRLQPGQGLLQLPLVKFIGDIVEGTDVGDALAESYLLLEGIPLPNHLQQILRILGVLSPLGQGIIPGLKGLYIGAGIGKTGKFPVVVHDQSSLG